MLVEKAPETREEFVQWLRDYNGPHSEAIFFASLWFEKGRSTLYKYIKEAGGVE